MTGEEKLVFLKAHLGGLSPTVTQQLKRDILTEKKRREAEATTKAKRLGKRPTVKTSGNLPGSAGGVTVIPQKAPRHHRQAQS
jgi:hypothetical protein